MKSRPNPFAQLLRLAIVVEMVLGSTIYFPAVALASAPEKVPFAPALQSGNHAPVAAGDAATTDEDTAVTIFKNTPYCLSVQQWHLEEGKDRR